MQNPNFLFVNDFQGKSMYIYNAQNKLSYKLSMPNTLGDIQVLNNGTTIFTVVGESINIYEASTLKLIKSITLNSTEICLKLSNDQTQLFISYPNTIISIDTKTFEKTNPCTINGIVYKEIFVSDDNNSVLFITKSKTIGCLNISTGKTQYLSSIGSDNVKGVCVNSDFKTMYISTQNTQSMTYEIKVVAISKMVFSTPIQMTGENSYCGSLYYNSSNNSLYLGSAGVSGVSGKLGILNLTTGGYSSILMPLVSNGIGGSYHMNPEGMVSADNTIAYVGGQTSFNPVVIVDLTKNTVLGTIPFSENNLVRFSNINNNIPKPVISSLSSETAKNDNTEFIINGHNFNTNKDMLTVIFSGGEKGMIISSTATSITVKIPKITPKHLSGSITVSNYGVTSAPSNIKFSFPPIIQRFTAMAEIGGTINIEGLNFSETSSENKVIFYNDITSNDDDFESSTSTKLTLKVPAGVQTGKITVVTNEMKSAASADDLFIIPTISSFSVNPALVGKPLEIIGTGFDTNASNNKIYFTGSTEPVIADADSTQTSLSVTVPSTVYTGMLYVQIAMMKSNSKKLNIKPTITSITEKATIGSVITINGTGFSKDSANMVSFPTLNGETAFGATRISATAINVIVPPNTITGTITVKVDNISSDASATARIILQKISSLSSTQFEIGNTITV